MISGSVSGTTGTIVETAPLFIVVESICGPKPPEAPPPPPPAPPPTLPPAEICGL